jgi:Caspase domain
LEKLFKERLHYQTKSYKIPTSDNPGLDLKDYLSREVARPNPEQDSLVILYYGGHGEVEGDRLKLAA